MTAPTPERVRVATAALRAEAQLWLARSDRMADLARAADRLGLGRVEAGVFQLVVDAYNAVAQVVARRCREGTTAMAQIGATLHQVADVYDAEDANAEHRIRQLY